MVAAGLAAWGWTRVRAASHRAVEREYLTLGDSASLFTAEPSLALSPDGTTLVFKDARQPSRLWVKRSDALDPTPIAGTERAHNPVFSPDGEWVAFVADGRVRKVRVAGGAPLTVVDTAVGGYGGVAWLDDGTLVYVPPSLQELRRVSAAGGPSTVALAGTVLNGGGIGMPVALPGARGALFQYCSSGCTTMSVRALDLRTGKEKALLDDVAQAWYLPGGHLLYVRRDGVALVAPFDLSSLSIDGAAVPVLEDVMVINGFAQLAWSANGTLVYVRGAGTATEFDLERVSRSGAVTLVDSSWHSPANSLALSPDGRRMAVGVGLSSGTLNIWIKQLDRGTFTRLSFGGQDRRPAWSPDGRVVAFIRDTTGSSEVVARPADGSGHARVLARLDRRIQEVDWSRSGAWLLLRTDNGAAGAGDIVGVGTSGDTTPVPLLATPYTELHPALSPDGRWLAYTSNESGNNEVYVRPFPNTNGGRWQVSNGGGSEPRWSADGREIFFIDPARGLVAAQVRTAPTFAVTGLQNLFAAPTLAFDSYHQSYAVSPDGRAFYFFATHQSERGTGELRIVLVRHWLADVAAKLKASR